MSTDETARKHTSLLARPLGVVTRGVAKAPVIVLIVGLVIAAVCVGSSVFFLEFRTSRLDLLNPKSAFHQRWLAYLDEFGGMDDIVVVVNGDSQPAIVAAMDELAEVLSQQPEFRSIMQKVDLSALRAKGLHYLSEDELQQVERFLAEFQPVLDGDWNRLSLASAIARAAESPTAGTPTNNLPSLLLAALRGDTAQVERPQVATGLAQLEERLVSRHLLLNDGRTGVVRGLPGEGGYRGTPIFLVPFPQSESWMSPSALLRSRIQSCRA